jgi:Uncharacterized protein conserved in bacteria (DUF2330)
MPVFLVPFLVTLVAPAVVSADGMFVVPKFVWDKHKDINEPTQKAILVYDAGREDLILQVKYEGPVDEFGWLIPVPSPPAVQKGSMKCFYELSQYTQRRFGGATVGAIPAGLLGGDLAKQAEPPVKVIERPGKDGADAGCGHIMRPHRSAFHGRPGRSMAGMVDGQQKQFRGSTASF